ncbi:MAG: hypothetical protein NDJ89_13335 [Oligoflexia bacterium]|nr:hypothetical protein [Oligoflexia bacterium]
MKASLPHALLAALILGASASSACAAGGETQNGGSVIIDGSTYQLADLKFRPLEHELWQMDEKLVAELQQMFSLLRDIGIRMFRASGYRFGSLLQDEVFGPTVEYRLVSKLPAGCAFIPSENLPYGTLVEPVGCTRGSITYLLPAALARLDLEQTALLILHERLHAFAPEQPYEVKTDFINGLHYLRTRYQPALLARKWDFRFTPEEMRSIGVIHKRVAQLCQDSHPRHRINETGAVIPAAYAVPAGVTLGLGTFVLSENYSAPSIEGNGIEIFNSTLRETARIQGNSIRLESASVPEIMGNEISLVNTQAARVTGDRIRIKDSAIFASEVTGSDIIIDNTQGGSSVIQGQRIRILDSKLSVNGWQDGVSRVIGDDIQIESSLIGCLNLPNAHPYPLCVESRVEANDVALLGTQLVGAEIRGSGIYLKEVNLVAGKLSESAFKKALLDGTGLRIVRTRLLPGSSFTGTDVRIEDSGLSGAMNHLRGQNVEIRGSELASLGDLGGKALENLSLLNVKLDLDPALPVTLSPGLTLSNIQSLSAQCRSLQLGTGGPLILDGHQRSYRVRGGFWTGNCAIGTQAELERWAL